MLGPKHNKESLSNNICNLKGNTLASSTTRRKLGIIFDWELSFNSHVKQISRMAFFHLDNTAKIQQMLSLLLLDNLILYFQVDLIRV